MENKLYIAPTISVVEMDSEDLLNGINSLEDKVVIKPTTDGINKGNANIAAGKNHYNLWGYDDEEDER